MPDNQQRPTDLGEQLFGKIAGALAGQAVGEVPDSEKFAVLESLVYRLEELAGINELFAENIFEKFGSADELELARKPDIRDYLGAWVLATLQWRAENEDEVPPESGGADEGESAPERLGEGPVIDADYKVSPKGRKRS